MRDVTTCNCPGILFSDWIRPFPRPAPVAASTAHFVVILSPRITGIIIFNHRNLITTTGKAGEGCEHKSAGAEVIH